MRRRILKTTPTAIGINGAPPETREWFEGRRDMPITALVTPDFELMPSWWADYAARTPGAVPPSDAPPALVKAMFGPK